MSKSKAELNAWAEEFFNRGRKPASEMTLQEQLDEVEGELSPENLTCDGELSRSAVAKKYKQLMAKKKKIEAKIAAGDLF